MSSPFTRLPETNKFRQYFMKLTTPQASRYFQFAIYFVTSIAGLICFLMLPTNLLAVIGPFMVMVFAVFGFVGSVLSMISVLLNVKWLEQVGIILLLTSVIMYGVMTLYFKGGITVALFFVFALAISLVQRLVNTLRDK